MHRASPHHGVSRRANTWQCSSALRAELNRLFELSDVYHGILKSDDLQYKAMVLRNASYSHYDAGVLIKVAVSHRVASSYEPQPVQSTDADEVIVY